MEPEPLRCKLGVLTPDRQGVLGGSLAGTKLGGGCWASGGGEGSGLCGGDSGSVSCSRAGDGHDHPARDSSLGPRHSVSAQPRWPQGGAAARPAEVAGLPFIPGAASFKPTSVAAAVHSLSRARLPATRLPGPSASPGLRPDSCPP